VARKSEDDEFGAWNENYGESVETYDSAQAAATHSPPKGADQKPITDDKHEQSQHVSNDEKGPAPPLPARRKQAPELPKRPHERAEAQAAPIKPESTFERQQSVTDDSRPAIPAPVIDAQAEERGTLELEEADGVHVIDAPKDGSDQVIASSDHMKGGSASRKVTMEEVPEESAGGNATGT